ncbi:MULTISPECIES: hypothetical protein [Bacteria]|uniref:TrfB transcriptional repressor protein domain-containing protein n=1 Tax=Pseudomonas juntendi TaxID=2666183 RepID=A0ABZ2JKE4_9PSED|nr:MULTISPECIES: hypothetical protein [Bacteria]MBI6600668.1 hypothetical protein [Pseudomonas sp. S4_EA_1b]MCE0781532.1 hypothetical protein [Pseudomonas sp. NMI542_15]MCE0962573.1 hypothetical protein [Pseudomonas putida]MCE0990657.1 hypothetical protein [Pseudomonas alloputida]MDG9872445.1 hypothetical protein [Pseudomonas juntendi]
MDLKDMLRQIDEDLLAEILEAAHCALNRPGAAKRVAKAMNTSVERVRTLAYISAQLNLCPRLVPDISTVKEMEAFQARLSAA